MRVLSCLGTEHSLGLVLLAALICALGSWITVRLSTAARGSNKSVRPGWVFLGAVAAGSATWCTHFVAMLAYEPGVPVTYAPGLTAASLAIAIVVGGGAIWVYSHDRSGAATLGGGLLGAGVAAMHYTGMAAFSADAIVEWHPAYVVASLIFAVGLGSAAFTRASVLKGPWRTVSASGLMLLCVVSLHFTAMGALVVTPFAPTEGALTDDLARGALALAVFGVGILMLGTGAASHLIERQTRSRADARLNHLVEGAVDGMVVEQNGAITTINASFEAMIGAPREKVLGRSFSDLMDAPETLQEGVLVRAGLRASTGEMVPVEIAVREEEASGEERALVYAVRDVRARLDQERRITKLACFDSLTGLPNRASFLQHLQSCIRAAGQGEIVALLAIDLDRFKEVNDLHGHAAGDHVLRTISERISDALVEGEFIARLGGDEFVAVATVRDPAAAHELARRLEERLFEAVALGHVDVVCGGSIGIAVYPDDADDTTALMNNADLAMYRAKGSLAQRICFYESSMDEAVRERRRTATQLRDALHQEQFEVHYQVQCSIATGEATGYEALLRWRHPDRGFVSPAEFIPLAEESGLILSIGEWVLRNACAEAATWTKPYKIAINLSAVQLGQMDLPRLVHEVLLQTGLSPSRLVLEITETAMILDPERTTHVLRQIKALGVSIAMDDFGVGYSSLSTLRAFPFDKIKLDKSFMDEIDRSPQARAIIRAVLALGESLEIPIIAEGVETAAQLDFLRAEGCDKVQGFLLGKPMRLINGETAEDDTACADTPRSAGASN